MKNNSWEAAASLSAGISVIFLALAAHTLKDSLGSDKVSSITTAAQIQLFHAISVIILSIHQKNIDLKWTRRLLFSGSLIFSISIYFLATIPLTGFTFLKFLGPITPFGGLLLIIGWFMGAIKFLQYKK